MVRLASSVGGIFASGKILMTVLSLILSGLLLVPEPAGAWESRYNSLVSKLRNYEVDYGTSGTICEQIARLELYKRFYDFRNYVIETGIMYGHNNVVEGELDIVVFEKRSGKAVMVAEVKCSTNLPRAAALARKQRHRFLDAIELGTAEMWRGKEKFSIDRFQDLKKYWIIAQQGSLNAGFDYELGINLNEAAELRQAMLECQQSGECRAPSRGINGIKKLGCEAIFW